MLRFAPKSKFILSICVAGLLIFSFFLPPSSLNISSPQRAPATTTASRQRELWAKLKNLLATHPPGCNPPERLGSAASVGFEKLVAANGNEEVSRPDLVRMPDGDISKMRKAHHGFVDGLKLKGEWPASFTANTRGVVTTAGGQYLPVFLVSLRMLRLTGSDLPVEVFVLGNEYESEICNNILPTLNARCVILSNLIDIEIQHYQLKAFSMIFSSFQELIFLDSDAFPVKDPESYFDVEPFKSTGMIMWPDFWMQVNTASSTYYEISAQPIPSVKKRAASESGEIMIDKSKHQESLLLATYYNYYGPSHYYSLLSQGAQGEGDKETFLAAAAALNESFYTVSEKVGPIGRWDKDGLSGSAMVQFDPSEDYNLTRQGVWRIRDENVAPRIHPLFIHAHYPKRNPATIFDEGQAVNPTMVDGESVRGWVAPENIMETFDGDVEKKLWVEMKWVACECERCFEGWKEKKGICERVEKHISDIFW